MNMLNEKMIHKRRSSEFTDTHLRLLSGQAPAREDWEAAAELIEAGMATGHVHRSSQTAANEIDDLSAFAPTLQGRLYAQQLLESKRTNSLIGRLQKWVWALAVAVGGILATAFSDLLKEAMQRWLGW